MFIMETSDDGHNFIIGGKFLDDKRIFFGDGDAILLASTASWEDVAIAAGFFASRSQARKSGWAGEIPTGWTERGFGKIKSNKFKSGVWIVKLSEQEKLENS